MKMNLSSKVSPLNELSIRISLKIPEIILFELISSKKIIIFKSLSRA